MWIAAFDYIIKCGKAIGQIIEKREAKRREKEAEAIKYINKNYKTVRIDDPIELEIKV